MIDHNGYVRMINPEFTRITGGVTTAIIGKSLEKYRSWAQPELSADSLRPLKLTKLWKLLTKKSFNLHYFLYGLIRR